MHDFFPFSMPSWLIPIAEKIAIYTDLPTLPYHLHEILFAAFLYQFVLVVISPFFSNIFFPEKYNAFSPRTRFNWDVHVVSLVQSVLICIIALYVAINDNERNKMTWVERIYGYTGALGLVQAFAAGYFVWDLYVCVRYIDMFGLGMLAHAISALYVYSFGFRPFVNWYATPYILYELSSPFLNIHWFCDKLNLTGGTVQLVNGFFLLITFAGCRLIYGSYISMLMWYDIFRAVKSSQAYPNTPPLAISHFALNATTLFESPIRAMEVLKFARSTPHIPFYTWGGSIASNLVLHILNWYWYGKMISAIRKRFDPPFGTRRKDEVKEDVKVEKLNVSRGIESTGRKILEVDEVEVKKRVPISRNDTSDDIPPPQ